LTEISDDSQRCLQLGGLGRETIIDSERSFIALAREVSFSFQT